MPRGWSSWNACGERRQQRSCANPSSVILSREDGGGSAWQDRDFRATPSLFDPAKRILRCAQDDNVNLSLLSLRGQRRALFRQKADLRLGALDRCALQIEGEAA